MPFRNGITARFFLWISNPALYCQPATFRILNHVNIMASPHLQSNTSALNKSANNKSVNNKSAPPPPPTWSNLMAITQIADVWLSYQCLHCCQNGVNEGLCVSNSFLSENLVHLWLLRRSHLENQSQYKLVKVVTVRFHYPVLWSHFYRELATLRCTVILRHLWF